MQSKTHNRVRCFCLFFLERFFSIANLKMTKYLKIHCSSFGKTLTRAFFVSTVIFKGLWIFFFFFFSSFRKDCFHSSFPGITCTTRSYLLFGYNPAVSPSRSDSPTESSAQGNKIFTVWLPQSLSAITSVAPACACVWLRDSRVEHKKPTNITSERRKKKIK